MNNVTRRLQVLRHNEIVRKFWKKKLHWSVNSSSLSLVASGV